MKKKYLLTILPALLVLSSCQVAPKANELKEDIFIEDTEAHDEIFGNYSKGRKIAPYKLGDDPVTHPDSDASIGVQALVDDKDTPSTADDTISIRFVAPVTFGEGQLDPTEAVWTRTVSSPDGSSTPKAFGTVASTHAYTQLQNGGGVYTIAQFNEAQEPDSAYTHFVVYTLRDIPLETYANYYVSAYLTLSGEGGVALTTKAVVTTIDPSIFQAAYNHSDGLFFVSGTVNGSEQIVNATTVREGGNKCSFENLNLAAGDNFVIKEFYDTKLEIHGSSIYRGDVCDFDLNDDDVGGKIGINYAGKYNLYLKYVDDHNELWVTASNLVRPMYIKTEYVKGDWFAAEPKIRLWCVKDDIGAWVDLKTVAAQDLYVTDGNFDPTTYDYIIVARTDATEPGTWWNQTINVGDLNRSDSDSNGAAKILNCIAIWNEKDGSNHYKYGWEYATGNPID